MKFFHFYFLQIKLLLIVHSSFGIPIEVVQDQDVWIPDLRGIPLGRQGEIVAEFSVSSSNSNPKTSKEEELKDLQDDLIVRPSKEYNACTDEDSKIVLYPKTEGEKPLPLSTAVEQFGRFESSGFDEAKEKVEFKSVAITGKCCWEFFTRPLYNGKKLRMCKGKFSARDMGIHASEIASIRPVNFLG